MKAALVKRGMVFVIRANISIGIYHENCTTRDLYFEDRNHIINHEIEPFVYYLLTPKIIYCLHDKTIADGGHIINLWGVIMFSIR